MSRDLSAPAWTIPAGQERPLARLGRRLLQTPIAALFVLGITLASIVLLPVTLAADAARMRLVWTRAALFLLGIAWIQATALSVTLLFVLLTAGRPEARMRWISRWTSRFGAALHRWGERTLGFQTALEGDLPVPAERPLIALIRHASAADGFLPALLLGLQRGFTPRVVLKREMMSNPWIDWAAHAYPNRFVARRAGRGAAEAAHIAALATDLQPGDAIFLWPEGTYFSPRKREEAIARLEAAGSAEEAAYAASLSSTLTPFRSGPLALIAANPGADILVIGHTGMDEARSVSAFLSGALIGRTMQVRGWLLPWREIEASEDRGLGRLREIWREVDAFAAGP